MKPKVNRAGKADKVALFDQCQTPPYALGPLLTYLPTSWTIWEPAAGEGNLVNALRELGYRVEANDLSWPGGRDFFRYNPLEWDVQVTNPPYSIKFAWIERSYELGKPFALLLPLETLGARRAQRQFERHGMELIVLDKRVNFKMPNIGWNGSAAQFPVAWFTHGLNIGTPLLYGKLPADLRQAAFDFA